MKSDAKTEQKKSKQPTPADLGLSPLDEDPVFEKLAAEISAAETDERAALTARDSGRLGFDATKEGLATTNHLEKEMAQIDARCDEVASAINRIDREIADLCMTRRHLRNEANMLLLTRDALAVALDQMRS